MVKEMLKKVAGLFISNEFIFFRWKLFWWLLPLLLILMGFLIPERAAGELITIVGFIWLGLMILYKIIKKRSHDTNG